MAALFQRDIFQNNIFQGESAAPAVDTHDPGAYAYWEKQWRRKREEEENKTKLRSSHAAPSQDLSSSPLPSRSSSSAPSSVPKSRAPIRLDQLKAALEAKSAAQPAPERLIGDFDLEDILIVLELMDA